MRESTKSTLESAFQQFIGTINTALEAELADASQSVNEIDGVVEALQIAETVPQFIDAAKKADLPIGTWAIDRLREAADPNLSNLPIRTGLYQQLVMIAHSRSISLEQLGRGELLSELLQQAINNGRV